jgi:hypothetical protein
MRASQHHWSDSSGWKPQGPSPDRPVQLVLAFANPTSFARPEWRAALREAYPAAVIAGCSTAGEIAGTQVRDEGVTCTAISFDRTAVRAYATRVEGPTSSEAAGLALAARVAAPDLQHVLVLSDGLHVNGSALVGGLTSALGEHVGVSGGLSADGDRFGETLVLLDDVAAARKVIVIGFYGSSLHVGCGSLGGWDPFGPERLITRSTGNVLYELDGRSALALYQAYLGKHAAGLPATALLFPLNVRASMKERPVVRTVLAVDPEAGTMTFAGDMPEGAYAQLMRANVDRLVDGAAGAAHASAVPIVGTRPALALLISCVGRRLVLRQRVEEEIEAVREIVGEDTVLAGFYSYGEISPFTPTARCELHNQTMTITTFAEG